VSLTTQLPGLYILDTNNRGRAVFCSEKISSGSLIEICPVIVLDVEDTESVHHTSLHDYYFIWDIDKGSSAIALGYGSIYNHSETPNAEFEIDLQSKVIRFVAIQGIAAGEEITIDYIAAKEEGIELWFNPV